MFLLYKLSPGSYTLQLKRRVPRRSQKRRKKLRIIDKKDVKRITLYVIAMT